MYFSRGIKEYSSVYGCDKFQGSLTPHIFNCIKADNCILDGEIIVYDTINKMLFTKAQGIDARNLKEDSRNFLPCFVAFDIVYLNDTTLTGVAFSERRRHLESVIQEREGYLQVSRQIKCETKSEVLTELNKVIERGEEGLILKKPDSLYVPDQRTNGGWYKIKPDYLEGLNDTIDAVVLGGYYGTGRQSGSICSYLCGLRNEAGVYLSFCKVSTGITKDEFHNKLSKLEAFWVSTNKASYSSVILSGREKPDVIIDPKKSLVMEILAAELISTSYFAMSMTARFPRVVRVRDDKDVSDCTHEHELKNFTVSNSRGISKIEESPKKKRKLTVDRHHFEEKRVEIKSDFLKGYTFCVLSESNDISRDTAVRSLREHSGDITNTVIDNCVVVCGRMSISVKNVISSQKHKVVNIKWVEMLQSKQRECPPYLIHFCPTHLQTSLSQHFDEYGDSFTDRTNPTELKTVFGMMDSIDRNANQINHQNMVVLKERYFRDFWRFSLRSYVILCPPLEMNLLLLQQCVLYGATIISYLNNSLMPSVTHRLDGHYPEMEHIQVLTLTDIAKMVEDCKVDIKEEEKI